MASPKVWAPCRVNTPDCSLWQVSQLVSAFYNQPRVFQFLFEVSFAHSSLQKSPSSLRFPGCLFRTALLRSIHRFSIVLRSGDCEDHGKSFSATGCNTTPKRGWSSPMLYCWTEVLFIKFWALSSPNVPLLIPAKQFYFNLIGPQKLNRLFDMFICELQTLIFVMEGVFFSWLFHEDRVCTSISL